MNTNNRSNHIYILDDLRGIAILTVVFYHYFFIYYRQIETNDMFIQACRTSNDYLNLGAFGVSLFFLVSGFVIPMSLKGENKRSIVYSFFVRRFFRLYPTYWVSIIFISSIIILFKDLDAYSIKQILINFTMLQDIFKVKSIDGVFWTLMIELKFYFLTAILFYFSLLRYIKSIILFFLILSILTLINWDQSFNPIIDAILHRNNLWSYLMLMYLGTAFYAYYIKEISRKTLLFLIMLVSVYYFSNHYFLLDKGFGDRLGYSIATIFAIISFTIFIQYKKSLFKITAFFGNISYSLYLVHQVIGYFLIKYFINIKINIPLAQIITLAILTIVALIIHKYVEKPTNKLGYKYAKKNK